MNIAGLKKAEVLMRLFNGSHQLGMGIFHTEGAADMTIDQAEEIVGSGRTCFDYLKGRVMKVDIGGDEVNTYAYNRDNGDGAAEFYIQKLKEESQ